jgi:hypothetical protein
VNDNWASLSKPRGYEICVGSNVPRGDLDWLAAMCKDGDRVTVEQMGNRYRYYINGLRVYSPDNTGQGQ